MGAPNDLQVRLAGIKGNLRSGSPRDPESEKCGTVDRTGVTEGRFVGPIAVRLKPEHRESHCEPLVLRINLSELGLDITERRTCY